MEYWQPIGRPTPDQFVMPSFTGQTGTFIHVGSGGGHRMDDLADPMTPGRTWFGRPDIGFSSLPPREPMIGQMEYYLSSENAEALLMNSVI